MVDAYTADSFIKTFLRYFTLLFCFCVLVFFLAAAQIRTGQLQAVRGAPADTAGSSTGGGKSSGDYATGGPQCDPSMVPAPAKATGLTKLAFCDDFSDIDKSFDLTDAYWNHNVKWSRKTAFWGIVLPVSDISVSDGVLKLNGSGNTWLITSALKDGKVHGYSITKEKEWYVEIKWKFGANYKKPVGQIPCFWSMDNCWLWKSPLCKGPFIEPDFYEPIDGNDVHGTHLHHWDSSLRMKSLMMTPGWKAGFAGDYTQWHTRALHVNPNQHEGRQVYYYNEKVQVDRTWTDRVCLDRARGKTVTCDFFKDLDQGSYPIIVNPGIGTVLYVDYVRVWVKP